MIILKGILTLLINPDFWSFARQVGEAVEAGHDYIVLQLQLKKFDKAVETAKKTKDTSELEAAFGSKPTDHNTSSRKR